jgi:hypothetical protein
MSDTFEIMQDYNIDDLFCSVNDIYAELDEGKIEPQYAKELLVRCCQAFVHFNHKENTK